MRSNGECKGMKNGKVHKLEAVKDDETVGTVEQEKDEAPTPQQGVLNAQSDMSKVAMVVSMLAVLLLVVFFFGMNRNIAGLSAEVQSLGVLRDDVADLDQRMVQLKTDVPVQMKRMIAHDMVNEMTMQSSYLVNALGDEELRTKMQAVYTQLKEVRDTLEK